MKIRNKSRRFTAAAAALTASVLAVLSLPMQGLAAGELRASAVPGDVNDDGEVTVIDLLIMQGTLHRHDNVTMYAPDNADLNGDDVFDIFDLGLAKRIVLNGAGTTIPIEPTDPDDPPVPQEGGTIYERVSVKDTYAGVVAYEGLIPEGWTVQIQSNWSCVGQYCGQESVLFTSPDGKASVRIASPQEYKQTTDTGEGVVVSQFTTYSNYKTAAKFIDNYVMRNFPDAELVREIEVPEEQQRGVTEFAFYQASALDAYIRQSGMNWQVVGYDGTVSRRVYYSPSVGYGEFCCAVPAYEYYRATGLLTTDNITWTTLNTIGYAADDEESYNKYYDEYEMIAANGAFTATFYSLVGYVTARSVQAIADGIYGPDTGSTASGDYLRSGTEVSDNDRATQERVFQAWDDYIREEDRYTTTDGLSFTTSMYNETVAQDGDKFYVGDLNGIPDGFTQLTKN
ncbi:MAG: dockerin type I repeat-containing protein [Oscillospiraceae bacterium]|nr:dockerin type I repeat-containing protein [Oscillospiraceae bacterium]